MKLLHLVFSVLQKVRDRAQHLQVDRADTSGAVWFLPATPSRGVDCNGKSYLHFRLSLADPQGKCYERCSVPFFLQGSSSPGQDLAEIRDIQGSGLSVLYFDRSEMVMKTLPTLQDGASDWPE